MRMHFDMARVYHQPFKVRLINKDFKEFLPYSSVSPSAETSMRVLPVTIIWRQIAPRGTCSQNPENCVDKLAVVSGVSSPGSFAPRKMIFQQIPNAI